MRKRLNLVMFLLPVVAFGQGSGAGAGGVLPEAPPSLSADEPIFFSGEDNSMVARGEATLTHRDVVLIADEIRYQRELDRATATGNVRVNQPGFRLVTERLVYYPKTRQFEAGRFRAAYPPVFVEGESFAGTQEEILFKGSRLYFEEPDAWGLSLQAEELLLRPDEGFRAKEVKMGLGGYSFLGLGEFSRSVGAPAMDVSGDAGYRKQLGAYLRLRSLFPVSENLMLGADVGIFSSRGVLAGPSLEWNLEQPEGNRLETSVRSGWMADRSPGKRGEDIFGEPVEESRYFLRVRHKQEGMNGRLELKAKVDFHSDSEVVRDFRWHEFHGDPEAETFVEVTYLWEDVVLSAFVRPDLNRDYIVLERLPEVRLDFLPTSVGMGGIYHGGSVVFTALGRERLDDSDWLPTDAGRAQANRFEVTQNLVRPLRLLPGVVLTPRVGWRLSHYSASSGGLPVRAEDAGQVDPGANSGASSATRVSGELGLDLEAVFFRDYKLLKEFWGIDGLRHVLRPSLHYRYQRSDKEEADLPYEERLPWLEAAAYGTLPLALNLGDRRAADAHGEHNFLRFGWHQLLRARLPQETEGTEKSVPAYRDLLDLEILQDLNFANELSSPKWENTWLVARLQPADFLELGLETSWETSSLTLNDALLRLSVRSADLWRLDLFADYLRDGLAPLGVVDQYAMRFWTRFHEKWAGSTFVRYDADLKAMTELRLGLTQRLGNSWDILYEVVYFDEARREDEWSFSLSVNLITF